MAAIVMIVEDEMSGKEDYRDVMRREYVSADESTGDCDVCGRDTLDVKWCVWSSKVSKLAL